MDVIRPLISYRNIKIAWLVDSDVSKEKLLELFALNFHFWGGIFNPIIQTDNESLALDQLEVFQPEHIYNIFSSARVKDFCEKHKLTPKNQNDLINNDGTLSYLDVWHPLRQHLESAGLGSVNFLVNILSSIKDSKLNDLLKINFGSYETNILPLNLQKVFEKANGTYKHAISDFSELSNIEFHKTRTICTYSALDFRDRGGHFKVGFYIGDTNLTNDLIEFWNLRAIKRHVFFLEKSQLFDLLPFYDNISKNFKPTKPFDKFFIWIGEANNYDFSVLTKEHSVIISKISDISWNGLNFIASNLRIGNLVQETGYVINKPYGTQVNIEIKNKPFLKKGIKTYQQHILELFDQFYLPDANEGSLLFLSDKRLQNFYSRKVFYEANRCYVKKNTISIEQLVDESYLNLSVFQKDELVQKIFENFGFRSNTSNAGSLTIQINNLIGGLMGSKILKIPGVRVLINEMSDGKIKQLTEICKIISSDPTGGRGYDGFSNFFFNGTRAKCAKDIFEALISRDILLIGKNINCSSCNLSDWKPLNSVVDKIDCIYCKSKIDVRLILANQKSWDYKLNGLLQYQESQLGAKCVLMTLEKLTRVFKDDMIFRFGTNLISGSIRCESDFLILQSGNAAHLNRIVLSECKENLPIEENDILNLTNVLSKFDESTYERIIVLSKLSYFSQKEIDLVESNQFFGKIHFVLLDSSYLEVAGFSEEPFQLEHGDIVKFSALSIAHAKSNIQLFEARKNKNIN